MGASCSFSSLQFLHELIVDVQAAGGVDQQDVAAGLPGFAERGAGELGGLGFFGRSFVDRELDVAGDDAQLLARGGAVNVDGNHQRAVAVFRQPARELSGGGGLAGALQADDQHGGGRLIGHPQLGLMAAERLDHLVADDLDDLLGGREGGEHFLAHGFFLDVLDELLDDAEMDVGFEQRHADLAQRGLHVFGGQFSFAAQVLEDALQFVG